MLPRGETQIKKAILDFRPDLFRHKSCCRGTMLALPKARIQCYRQRLLLSEKLEEYKVTKTIVFAPLSSFIKC